jgi:hypothetical protein
VRRSRAPAYRVALAADDRLQLRAIRLRLMDDEAAVFVGMRAGAKAERDFE